MISRHDFRCPFCKSKGELEISAISPGISSLTAQYTHWSVVCLVCKACTTMPMEHITYDQLLLLYMDSPSEQLSAYS